MLKIKPIIIVAGEPNSVFLEIFFKTLKKSWFNKFSRPLILIASSNLILDQMKKLGFNFKIKIIKPNFKSNFGKIDNTKINVINVNLNYKKEGMEALQRSVLSNNWITLIFVFSILLLFFLKLLQQQN